MRRLTPTGTTDSPFQAPTPGTQVPSTPDLRVPRKNNPRLVGQASRRHGFEPQKGLHGSQPMGRCAVSWSARGVGMCFHGPVHVMARVAWSAWVMTMYDPKNEEPHHIMSSMLASERDRPAQKTKRCRTHQWFHRRSSEWRASADPTKNPSWPPWPFGAAPCHASPTRPADLGEQGLKRRQQSR